MDTRFWGPSGWRLLHMITFAYTPDKDKHAMRQFFEVLPFVLPCKFCRSNLVSHYEKLPLEEALESKETLSKWLYEVHNLTNEKLRSQGQKIPDDPPFSHVKERYEELLAFGCSKTDFPGWEFLFSIVETNPLLYKESPLPEAPPKEMCKTKTELLQWNYLSGSCRFNYVCRFWRLLPHVLPFDEWKTIWKEEIGKDSKQLTLRSLWQARKHIEDKLSLLNRTSYHDLCKTLRYYKSGCAHAQNKQTRTCRRFLSRTERSKTKRRHR